MRLSKTPILNQYRTVIRPEIIFYKKISVLIIYFFLKIYQKHKILVYTSSSSLCLENKKKLMRLGNNSITFFQYLTYDYELMR